MARTRSPPSAEGLMTSIRLRSHSIKQLPATNGSAPACQPQAPCSVGGDAAGGPARMVSLSSPGLLPRLCLLLPGFMLWGGLLAVVTAAAFSTSCFYVIAASLSIFTMLYSSDLSISSLIGAWRMRAAARKDWHAMLEALLAEQPELSDVTHVVIIPNYKEDEEMLLCTLENIAKSPMAADRIKVVLAMEEREGPKGAEKAARLVEKMKHQFADIFATFHPANLPGDLAGKSSNTQWAYKQMLTRYSNDLNKRDTSRVLLSVGDADTLWHRQYFSALSYEALTMPVEQRKWAFWQAPMLLMRNMMSVPAMSRVSGYATLLFELAGMTNQMLAPAFCFSSYSCTLALANHPMIGGWDRDVIAEDHHMFCKCFFASIRDGKVGNPAEASAPKVKVHPLYLPHTAFLVESDGYISSCYARFQQAVRHAQGVAELSYAVLQYFNMIRDYGVFKIPLAAHARTCGVIYKMIAVHMVNQIEAFAVILAAATALPSIVRWVLTGGCWAMLRQTAAEGLLTALGQQSFGEASRWTVQSICGPIPPVLLMMVCTSFVVVKDLLEGKLSQPSRSACKLRAGEKDHKLSTPAAELDVQGFVGHSLGVVGSVKTYAMIFMDYASWAQWTLLFYGLVPVMVATVSLIRNGAKCEYIVAAKPT